MRNNNTKLVAIIALAIAIIGLSIGFAAFASTLNIATSATVNPTNTFSVKFSNSDNSLSVPNVSPTNNSTASGDIATINNDNNPIINNLSAAFTAPGQKVEYVFYVRNMGNYDAYLTDVRFNNAANGSSFKKCTATSDNPVSNANSMCDYITFTLELADSPSNKELTPESNFQTIVGNNYIVNKSADPTTGNTNSKLVKVTIEYPSDSPYSDGAFTVSFGSVEMIFATLQGYVPQTPATSELDVWYSRGLTSPNARVGTIYSAIDETPFWEHNFILETDGSLSTNNRAQTVDSNIIGGLATCGENYVILDASSFGYDVYQTIEFLEDGQAIYYLVQKSLVNFGDPNDPSYDPLGTIKTAYGVIYDENKYIAN